MKSYREFFDPIITGTPTRSSVADHADVSIIITSILLSMFDFSRRISRRSNLTWAGGCCSFSPKFKFLICVLLHYRGMYYELCSVEMWNDENKRFLIGLAGTQVSGIRCSAYRDELAHINIYHDIRLIEIQQYLYLYTYLIYIYIYRTIYIRVSDTSKTTRSRIFCV